MASYSTSDKFNRYHHAKTLSDSKGESHGTLKYHKIPYISFGTCFVLISWRAEKFCQGAHWMFSRVMMRKRINDDQDEYIYIYIICEYVAECDNDE